MVVNELLGSEEVVVETHVKRMVSVHGLQRVHLERRWTHLSSAWCPLTVSAQVCLVANVGVGHDLVIEVVLVEGA